MTMEEGSQNDRIGVKSNHTTLNCPFFRGSSSQSQSVTVFGTSRHRREISLERRESSWDRTTSGSHEMVRDY